MARKEKQPVEEVTVAEEVELSLPQLLVVTLIKCDGIIYKPGDEFPLEHPEAERLFKMGVLESI